jgi:hypothetical protein
MGFISDKAYKEGYENGLTFAETQLINKACEWLESNLYEEDDVEWSEDGQRTIYTTVKTDYGSKEDFIGYFRKAMEKKL